jgi:hypothetical protein
MSFKAFTSARCDLVMLGRKPGSSVLQPRTTARRGPIRGSTPKSAPPVAAGVMILSASFAAVIKSATSNGIVSRISPTEIDGISYERLKEDTLAGKIESANTPISQRSF